jgi:transposase
MRDGPILECPNCRRLQARVAELEARIARLEKNSSNSHKPPSSDIVKPKEPKAGKAKRSIGGQPGHPKHQRRPFPPEELDATCQYTLQRCPDCGTRLKPARRRPRTVQQVEVIERPIRIEEHRALGYWCPRCRALHWAPLPPHLARGGLAGARLTALVAYLKGGAHASYSTIQAFLCDVMKVSISRGQLVRLVAKASQALAPSYDELLGRARSESQFNVDETGHKDNGSKYWTWCFRADPYTLFRIDRSRGSQVLIEVLGEEFNGVLGCDYFSAYRKYMKDFGVQVQFCLAHLIRDVKYLTTLGDRATSKYGDRVLDHLRGLFRVIHRRQSMSEERFQQTLERRRRALVATAKRAPWGSEAQNMADRFRRHGDAYFRFITTPGVAPTNNLAEQAIRFVVIDRRITQGTRGEAGRRWSERIWTAMASCAQQGRSAFDFIERSVQAHFSGQPPPSLLTAPP